MISTEHQFTLPVPPQEAFALLSDPAKEPDWQSACMSSRLLDGEARTGCRYEILFHMVGRKLQFTVEVLDYQPGVLSRFTTLDGPFGYQGAYHYSGQPDGITPK